MRDLILKTPLFVGTLVACVAFVACATSPEREPFTEEAPVTPAETPEKTATPPKTTQSGPATTGTDAGPAKPDAAPDTCKRTAPSNKCGVSPQCGCTLAETC